MKTARLRELETRYEGCRDNKECPRIEVLIAEQRVHGYNLALADLARLEAAAHKAQEHIYELGDAWRRGALSEHDDKSGTRSNRNHDIGIELREALAEVSDA